MKQETAALKINPYLIMSYYNIMLILKGQTPTFACPKKDYEPQERI